jgi:hypothetical protein
VENWGGGGAGGEGSSHLAARALDRGLGRVLARVVDALADGRVASELLRDAHGVAVELLAEVVAQRRPGRRVEQAIVEIADDALDVALLLHRPLAAAQAAALGHDYG